MNQIKIEDLGTQEYTKVWKKQKAYTHQRDYQSSDQIWHLQHEPVFTLGQAGKPEHILKKSNIPIVHSDRGGQVTYHGPGQLVIYLLCNLPRKNLGVRAFVTILEQSVQSLLEQYEIQSATRLDAPGVYINNEKICSVGIRVRQGNTYHGLSLNIDMDLDPFTHINPCGYTDMKVTQLKQHYHNANFTQVKNALLEILCEKLT